MPALAALLLLAVATFGKLWSPSDLKRLQAELDKQAKQLDLVVKSCATLSSERKAAWANTLANVQAYVATDFGWITTTLPDGTTHFWGGDRAVADTGEALARELYSWGQILTGQNCSLLAPNMNPNTADQDRQKTLDTVASIVKYGSVAVAFVGSAYVVGKVVDLVTKVTPTAKRA